MKRRFVIALVFALLMLAGALAPGGAQSDRLKEIVPGVWFREGEREQGHCNNVIIEMNDYLIVVDANFPSGARVTLADAKAVSSKPVRYVFDTHHHGDHLYGNPIWTKVGAITLAYHGVVEEMKRYEPQGWRDAAKTRKDVAELNLAEPEPPKQTFRKTPHVIQDGGRRVEFHFFGWAHTRGDGFVYLPKEKVLCTGDAVVNGPYNFTGHANLKNWPQVIRAAQKLDVSHVLPGHGAPGGKDIMEGQARFFAELLRAVESAVSEGKTLEQIVTMRDGSPATTTIRLPESVKNWTGGSLPAQVSHMYEEIAQGRPYGEIAGGK